MAAQLWCEGQLVSEDNRFYCLGRGLVAGAECQIKPKALLLPVWALLPCRISNKNSRQPLPGKR